MKKFKRNNFGGILNNSILQIILICWAIIELAPIIWIFYSSFKPTKDIVINVFSLPKTLYLDNYNIQAMADQGIFVGVYYRNSIIVTLIALSILLITSLLGGYAIAKLKFPGKDILLIILVGILAVPVHALIIPLYYFFSKIGLLNNVFGMVFPLVAVNIPFTTIMIQSYFRSFPDDIIEAAKIDGCSNFRVFFSIMLPVAVGSISAVLVVNFMRIWNEFFIGLVILKDNFSRTLPVGLQAFIGEWQTDYGPMFGVIVLAIIPTIMMFAFFSRYMIRGLTAGSIKG